MKGDGEAGFFNFSFLDILACTVGAIVFLLMALATQLSFVAPRSLPVAERDALRARRDRARAALASLDATSLREETAALRSERAANERRARALRARLRSDEAKAAELEARSAGGPRKVEELAPILPRPTQRTQRRCGLNLVCGAGVVDEVFVRISDPHGEPPRRTVRLERLERYPIAEPAGARRLSARLRRIDPRRHYVGVLLRSDGFATFRELRRRVHRAGFEMAWQPLPSDEWTFDVAPELPSPDELRTD